MSDYYWEQDRRDWNAHLNYEANEKRKKQVADRKMKSREREESEKQKVFNERFTRMPDENGILLDCAECGRSVPVFRLSDGVASSDYYPRCPGCGKENLPIILGSNVSEFVVEKIDYDDDEYW